MDFLRVEPIVLETFAEHLVASCCIDVRLLGNSNSVETPNFSDDQSISLSALFVLGSLVQHNRAFTAYVGKVVVPAGARYKMTGRPFAECFLDFAAKSLSFREDPLYCSNKVAYYSVCIYKSFCRCRDLATIIGSIDHEFLALENGDAFEVWAQARLDEST